MRVVISQTLKLKILDAGKSKVPNSQVSKDAVGIERHVASPKEGWLANQTIPTDWHFFRESLQSEDTEKIQSAGVAVFQAQRP